MAISLMLIEDHTLVREMLKEKLSQESDMQVVGAYPNADEALEQVDTLKPDIILMDIDMPGLLCFEAARRIVKDHPRTRVIFLSAYYHDRYIEQALQVEAAGYMTKTESPESMLEAIRTVAGGGSHFSPEVQARIVMDSGSTRLAGEGRSRLSLLTPRELEVLGHIARGLSQKEIANHMGLSPKTVHCHCINLMTKLDIHDRVELTRFAIREGLAEA